MHLGLLCGALAGNLIWGLCLLLAMQPLHPSVNEDALQGGLQPGARGRHTVTDHLPQTSAKLGALHTFTPRILPAALHGSSAIIPTL